MLVSHNFGRMGTDPANFYRTDCKVVVVAGKEKQEIQKGTKLWSLAISVTAPWVVL